MKNIILLFPFLLVVYNYSFSQNVGIGTKTPAASAQLDINSSSKGFLPPRLTLAQRNNIISPATGLVIWCIDCDEMQVYNGTIWKNLSGMAASGVSAPNVTICNQVWTIKNLAVSSYRNGDPIPQVTDAAIWANLTIGAWCWFNNDSVTYAAYGKLYNWYAVIDARGLAPEGWHIPTVSEFVSLNSCLGGVAIAGGKLKETKTTHWLDPNVGATNSSGFTGLPGGSRSMDGSFGYINKYGTFWSTTQETISLATVLYLTYADLTDGLASGLKSTGFSVRCIRN